MRPALAAFLVILPAVALARSDAPEAALARALHGLTPSGRPTSCVSLRDVPESQIVDDHTILFRHDSGRVYVNHPPDRCIGLTRNHAFASRTPTGQLCGGDLIRVFDPAGHFDYGSCPIGDFQLYTR